MKMKYIVSLLVVVFLATGVWVVAKNKKQSIENKIQPNTTVGTLPKNEPVATESVVENTVVNESAANVKTSPSTQPKNAAAAPAVKTVSPTSKPAVAEPKTPPAVAVTAPVKYESKVFINGNELAETQMEYFKSAYGKAPVPGKYWYDYVSGLYGLIGGPSVGYISAGLNFGAMAADSSNGSSAVFINGRELPQSEVNLLSSLVGQQVQAGYYWLLSNGNAGIVGYNVPLVNLFAVASRGGSGGGSGSNMWSSGQYSGGNYYTDSSGAPSQGYVSVPGYGPVGYGF